MINRRKGWMFICWLCVSVLTLALFAGCGKQEEDHETPPSSVNYIIDVASVEFSVGEVGDVYSLPLPKVIDRSGKEASGFSVKVESVKNEAGKEYVVAARRFTPDAVGKYTVAYTCNNEQVKDAVGEITVQDTKGPEINIKSAATFVFTDEATAVPDFEAEDASGIDESKTYVKIYDAEGTEIIPEDGKFTLTETGKYKYEFLATDKIGNETKQEMSVTATDLERKDGAVTYWTQSSVVDQTAKYAGATMPELSWDEEFKDPDGNGTLKITTTSAERYAAFALSCAITDWSSYDYIGFWVHNPTDLVLTGGFIQISSEDTFVLKPNSWTYVSLSAKTDSYVDANIVADKHTDRHQIVFAIYDRYWDKVNHTVGTEFHVSNMNLYKHSEDTDVLLGFGDKESAMYIGVNEGYMEMYAESVTENKFGDDAYALKLTKIATSPKETDIAGLNFWYRNQIEKNLNKESRYYTINVYNPNSYDIVVIDNDAWGAASEGANYSTTIKAGQSGKVLVQIRNTNVNYLSVFKYDSSKEGKERLMSIEMGGSVLLGTVRTTDNVTDKSIIDGWNEAHGDAVIAEYFG